MVAAPAGLLRQASSPFCFHQKKPRVAGRAARHTKAPQIKKIAPRWCCPFSCQGTTEHPAQGRRPNAAQRRPGKAGSPGSPPTPTRLPSLPYPRPAATRPTRPVPAPNSSTALWRRRATGLQPHRSVCAALFSRKRASTSAASHTTEPVPPAERCVSRRIPEPSRRGSSRSKKTAGCGGDDMKEERTRPARPFFSGGAL